MKIKINLFSKQYFTCESERENEENKTKYITVIFFYFLKFDFDLDLKYFFFLKKFERAFRERVRGATNTPALLFDNNVVKL